MMLAKEIEARIQWNNRKGRGKGTRKIKIVKPKLSPPRYWNPEGKSNKQIDEAFFCARRNLYNENHGKYLKKGSNQGTRDLFRVIYYIYIYIYSI